MSQGVELVESSRSLEAAAALVDECYRADRALPDLQDRLLRRPSPTLSGLSEDDYATADSLGLGPAGLELHASPLQPLPSDLVDQFAHMQANCAMGLLPDVRRAWVAIDSDLFLWNYESGRDLAFLDTLPMTILTLASAPPRPSVFAAAVRLLLVVATPAELVVLAATFKDETGADVGPGGSLAEAELSLIPEPAFRLSLDGAVVTQILSTPSGRIFFADKEGCLQELLYQDKGWLRRSAKASKVNHSKSFVSIFLPSFVAYALRSVDPLLQLVHDASRHLLFARSESGGVEAWDLGPEGKDTCLAASLSADHIRAAASAMAPTIEPKYFAPIVDISVLPASESQDLNLIGVTSSGVRLYFSVSGPRYLGAGGQGLEEVQRGPKAQTAVRAQTLRLAHVRLPTGLTPNLHLQRPSAVHLALCRREFSLWLTADRADVDVLWCHSAGHFPSQPGIQETVSTLQLQGQGRSWCLVEEVSKESPDSSALEAWVQRNPQRTPPLLPPLVVRQHREAPRIFRVLSAHGIQRLELLRPLDILKRLLLEHGADSEPVQRFFQLHKAEQAGAMCLCLAASTAAQDRVGVTGPALRAFFLYGGEPSLIAPPAVNAHPHHPHHPQHQHNGSVFELTTQPGSPRLHSTPTSAKELAEAGYAFPPTAARAAQPTHGAGDVSLLQLTSTVFDQPHSPGQPHGQPPAPEVAFSAAHNALYLYLSRILGTLWEIRMTTPTAGAKKEAGLSPALGREEALWLADQVEGLETLMREQALVPAHATPLHNLAGSPPRQQLQTRLVGLMRREGGSQRSRAEAGNVERESLLRLMAWLGRARQVLRLWALLVENQFPLLVGGLSEELRGQLRQAHFRGLVVSGGGLCLELINALISLYLGDYATTDAVSERLRAVCPALFTSDDATAAKASELLSAARGLEDGPARAANVHEALLLFKKVPTQLDLHLVAAQLAAVQAYEGIVDLALAAAEKLDPEDHAGAFYRSAGEESSVQTALTSAGRVLHGKQRDFGPDILALHKARMAVYACVGEQLDVLLGSSGVRDPRLSPAATEEFSEGVLRAILSSKDELAHVYIFDWLIQRNLAKKLIHLSSPYLEFYLQRRVAASLEPGSGGGGSSETLLDLLWEFYQRQGRFEEAAQLLGSLAERRAGPGLGLEQRLRYLSRALACAKAAAQPDSMRIQELEDKLEVGHLQAEVQKALSAHLAAGGGSVTERQAIRDAVSRLSAALLDVTELYSDYAERFSLCEAKLAIVHCAGVADEAMVADLWREIVDRELALCPLQDPTARSRKLASKVLALAQRYAASPRFFPLGQVASTLEAKAVAESFAAEWLPRLLLDAGVGLGAALETFQSLYTQRPKGSRARATQEHLLHSVLWLLSAVWGSGQEGGLAGRTERRQLSSRALDLVALCALDVLKLPDTEASRRLRQGFDAAQRQLQRLLS